MFLIHESQELKAYSEKDNLFKMILSVFITRKRINFKSIIVIKRRNPMTISSPEREAKKVKIAVDRNPVETSFEKWACDLK